MPGRFPAVQREYYGDATLTNTRSTLHYLRWFLS
jgi:hypothetical protein